MWSIDSLSGLYVGRSSAFSSSKRVSAPCSRASANAMVASRLLYESIRMLPQTPSSLIVINLTPVKDFYTESVQKFLRSEVDVKLDDSSLRNGFGVAMY